MNEDLDPLLKLFDKVLLWMTILWIFIMVVK